MKPAVSVTNCVGGGGMGVSFAPSAFESRRTHRHQETPKIRFLSGARCRTKLELHLRRLLRPGLRFEVRLFLKLREKARDHDSWKRIALGIEFHRPVIESPAFDSDAILCPCELHRKISKTLSGFQFRIP